MKPRKCDIIELAVWLHERAMEHPYTFEKDSSPGPDFNDLSSGMKDRYKYVAEQLLTNPPVFMRRDTK